MDTKKVPKSSKNFICKNCDYVTGRESQYIRHLSTPKHKRIQNDTKKVPKSSEHICNICNKKYKYHSGLWKHKKSCTLENEENKENEEIDEENEEIDEDQYINYKGMFLQMMDQMKKKDEQMDKIIPLIGNNNNNNINNQFNINVFLNEDCKDALNINDFVNSLQLQLKDLDNTGKLGFVEGTSKIFIDGLNKLEITKRPIHCSDIKEETLYIKDNDVWEKENKNNDKMKKAIDEITEQNMKQMPEWVKENPTFANDEEYLKVISNIMNVMDNNKQNKQKEKIINNVAKETIIDE